MNYGELKTSFEGLLKRRDLTAKQRDNFLTQGISRAQRVLRIPPMEKSIEAVYDGTSFSGGVLPVPGDYLRSIAVTVGDTVLKATDLNTVLKLRNREGVPTHYVRRGGDFWFGPKPAIGTAIRIDYYTEFGSLENDADENFVTVSAPDLALYAALSYAGDYFIDKRTPLWEDRFKQIVDELQFQSDQDELLNAQASSAYDYPED